MPGETKILSECACRKCGTMFTSTDQDDLEGYGECPPCKAKIAEIAKNVQKIIDQKRAARPPASPRVELPTMPGTNYINSRFLR